MNEENSSMNPPVSPLTGSERVELIRNYRVTALKRSWKRRFAMDIGPELPDLEVLSQWRCRDTQLEFFFPAVAGSAQLYQQLSRFAWYHDCDRWEFHAALDSLRPGGRLLEVGCGSGAFLDLACRRGEVTGLELNPDTAAQARMSGHHVIEAAADATVVRELAPFDAVCSFQVLEHVADPMRFLADLAALLKPGGLMLIGVPNADSFIRHWRVNLLDMPPHHVTRWHARTLRELASLLQLDLQDLLPEPLAANHAPDYVEAQVQRLLPIPQLGRAIGRLAGPLLNLFPRLRSRIPGHSLLAVYRKPG